MRQHLGKAECNHLCGRQALFLYNDRAANDVVKKTAQATHRSLQSSTLLSVVTLADQILRAQDAEKEAAQEPEKTKKKTPRPRKKDAADASDQMTIWDVMESP